MKEHKQWKNYAEQVRLTAEQSECISIKNEEVHESHETIVYSTIANKNSRSDVPTMFNRTKQDDIEWIWLQQKNYMAESKMRSKPNQCARNDKVSVRPMQANLTKWAKYIYVHEGMCVYMIGRIFVYTYLIWC